MFSEARLSLSPHFQFSGNSSFFLPGETVLDPCSFNLPLTVKRLRVFFLVDLQERSQRNSEAAPPPHFPGENMEASAGGALLGAERARFPVPARSPAAV